MTERPPFLRILSDKWIRILSDELIVDNFAGGGGASTGIGWALGRSPDIAVNHDAEALALHEANHPTTRHLREDVFAVNPRKVCGAKRVGVAWFSPDCFPAGTMILAREGYKPVEEIQVGDEMLTHNLRWRKVTNTMRSVKPLVRLRGQGHPGLLVSPEHPFYARRRTDVWRTNPRGYDRRLEPAAWTRAGDLDKGWYWASPTAFPAAEVPAVPVHRNRETTVTDSLLWLAGLYVADGWTRLTETRAELVITCGLHEVERLRQALSVWPRGGARSGTDELSFHERETGTAYQFTANHRGLVEWLREHFGHGAAEKRLPGWVLGMDLSLRKSFLAGYLSGDGCVSRGAGNPITIATTVSKALAFGLKALASSLGYTPSVYLRTDQPDVIEGRKVNVRPAWSVRWREGLDENHRQTFMDGDGLAWAAVKDREDGVSEAAEVFNLGVEDDESYVADGVVVHNCTFFSKARGGKPFRDRNKARRRRGLAGVVIKWAASWPEGRRPRLIAMENVEEFRHWAPLTKDGRPDPERRGASFRRWLSRLENLGYSVEWRELRACDFGAPTTRKRFFLLARCDGQPIVWPDASHGPGRLPVVSQGDLFSSPAVLPYRTAAECIDWSLECKSIFGRKKPLAEATLRRIARGLKRYVIDAAQPFVVPLTHHGERRGHPLNEPFPVVTGAHRGELALVSPYIARIGQAGGNGKYVNGVDELLTTITTKAEHILLAPTLINTRNGERHGRHGEQAPRVIDIDKPYPTITAVGSQGALVSAFLARHFGGPRQVDGASMEKPMPTITARDHHSAVTAHLVHLRGTAKDGRPVTEPLPTITAGGNHIAAVYAFLIKYYGSDQDPRLEHPLHTLTTKHRFGLVTVMIAGQEYAVVDIGMRMLAPHELFRAQGFGEEYLTTTKVNGKPLTKEAQIRLVGNSVSPPVAEALVRAQFAEREQTSEVA